MRSIPRIGRPPYQLEKGLRTSAVAMVVKVSRIVKQKGEMEDRKEAGGECFK